MLDLAAMDLAVLDDGQTRFTARAPRDAPPFLSAPALLIQGIYETRPEMARKIVRHRIFTTAPMSVSLHGLVKVAAKRITVDLSPDDPLFSAKSASVNAGHGHPEFIEFTKASIDGPHEIIELSTLPRFQTSGEGHEADRHWMKIAFELAARIPRQPLRFASDRPIAALLVSAQGELLSAAVNTNARNRIRHAEINLLDRFWRETHGLLPAGARLYTTLKPCKMCAGMIVDCAPHLPALRVFFGENDPGTNAQKTALDALASDVQQELR